MRATRLGSRLIAMIVVLACVPYLSQRCIDPASCLISHAGHNDEHRNDAADRHQHTSHGHAPASSPPSPRTCCELTGKLTIMTSEGAPAIAPLLVPFPMTTVPPSDVLRFDRRYGVIVPHTAHAPPAYLRNHTLLI